METNRKLLKSQIQKALEPFKTLLKSKKMEVQIVNKAKSETDIIIGIESSFEKGRQTTYTLLNHWINIRPMTYTLLNNYKVWQWINKKRRSKNSEKT
jgi:hypothetical protein